MSIIRRTFDIPEGTPNEYGLTAPGQLLVTYNDETDEVHVAHRPAVFDAWTRPFPEVDREDDPKSLTGNRVYGNDGRAYVLHPADDAEPVTLDPENGYPTNQ